MKTTVAVLALCVCSLNAQLMNGDFSQGLDGWNGSGISIADPGINGKSLSFDAQNGVAYQDFMPQSEWGHFTFTVRTQPTFFNFTVATSNDTLSHSDAWGWSGSPSITAGIATSSQFHFNNETTRLQINVDGNFGPVGGVLFDNFVYVADQAPIPPIPEPQSAGLAVGALLAERRRAASTGFCCRPFRDWIVLGSLNQGGAHPATAGFACSSGQHGIRPEQVALGTDCE